MRARKRADRAVAYAEAVIAKRTIRDEPRELPPLSEAELARRLEIVAKVKAEIQGWARNHKMPITKPKPIDVHWPTIEGIKIDPSPLPKLSDETLRIFKRDRG